MPNNPITRTAAAPAPPETSGNKLVRGTPLASVVGAITSQPTPAQSTAAGSVGPGSGDVIGPVSSSAGNIAIFADTSGKVIADGGSSGQGLPPGGTIGSYLVKNSPISTWVPAQVINVKNPPYNAVGDGVMDDTAALNSAVATIPVGGQILRIWVDNPGSGYTSVPTVNISSGAAVGYGVVYDGKLVAVVVTTNNTYATTPNISITGGGGSGATAYAIIGTPTTLYLPPGIYKTTTGLSIPANVGALTITGGGTIYCVNSSANCLGVNDTTGFITVTNINFLHFPNVLRWGPTPRDPGCGIRLKGRFHEISNCFFSQHAEFAINIGDDPGQPYKTRFFLISNNVVEDTFGDGIHAEFAQDGLIIGNICRRTGDDGVGVICSDLTQYTQRVKVIGNHLIDCSAAGIRVRGSLDVDIENNTINGSGQAGIIIVSASGISECRNTNVIGNTIRNPNMFRPSIALGRGIVTELSGSGSINYLRIINNTISDCQTANGVPIYLDSGLATLKNVMVCGNNFSNIVAGYYLITVGLSGNNPIRNNTCLDPGKAYIDSGTSTGIVAANNYP